MHEVSLVESLVEQVKAHAQGRKLRSIRLVVGVLTCVDPEAMTFCFAAIRQDVGLDDVELVIERQYAEAVCRQCGASFDVHSVLQPCECGSLDLELEGGGDVLLRELEFG